MVINISINKTFSIHDPVKNYSFHNVFNKKKYQYFDVLILIQMCTGFWQMIILKNSVDCHEQRM